MVYTLLFFSSKCSLFHNSTVFGSCIIHILYTGCAKIKKNNSGAKRLNIPHVTQLCLTTHNSQVLTHTTGMTQFLDSVVKLALCGWAIEVTE